MKKTILLILIASAFFNHADSQITKDNWLVGGNASFSHTNYNSDSYTHSKNTTFSISPNIGYFIWDKFCAGLKLSVNSAKNINPSITPGSISYKSRTTFINLGPFVRYYFLDVDKMVNVFIEGIYQYQLRKDVVPNSITKEFSNVFTVNAGPVIYLNSSVGIEFTVGYSTLKFENSAGTDNTIQTGLGLQIHLEKEKY
jgi:hypothetical protein